MDMEESLKVIEEMIKSYKEADKCGLSNNDFKNEIKALEYIVSDYKRLQEEFNNIDHECSRLENIDIKKDLKIIKLQEENKKQEELIEEMKRFLFKENKMCDFLESEG